MSSKDLTENVVRDLEMQEAAAQLLVDAMSLTLPCIDANDEPKTLACFRFYCTILSSVGQLPVRICMYLYHQI